MAKSGEWKRMYERQWRTFQKNIGIAQNRGYSIPEDILGIEKAKGGYKQAYERIHALDLSTIQRRSIYNLVGTKISGVRAMSMVVQQVRDVNKAMKNIEGTELFEIPKSTVQDIYDIYSAQTRQKEREPEVIIEEPDEDDIELPSWIKEAEDSDVMPLTEFYDQLDTNIVDLIKSFHSYPLRKKIESAYNAAKLSNYNATMWNLYEQQEEVIEKLQKAAELYYPQKGQDTKDYKEEESQWTNWWLETLTNL